VKPILLVRRRPSRFTDLDRDVLERFGPVREWAVRASPRALAATVRAVAGARMVVVWFAGPHAVLPLAVARALRRPSVVIVGGIDLAREPEIGYGMQQDPRRRRAVKACLRLATRIVTNSHYSAREMERHTGIPAERATVVHHGVPDPYGALPPGPRERRAVTVGLVEPRNLERKGLRAFVEAARRAPDVAFDVVGPWDDDASVTALRQHAGPNVTLTGWMEQGDLEALLTRTGVYVQASVHEGFGMAVAEAMLAGCIPVVTDAGALPEVVGDAGIVVPRNDPAALAEGVLRALDAGDDARVLARERVLREFPLRVREEGLGAVIASLAR
jgi:glycosyltransferase involved in cell wall biosynthesis